MLMKHVIPWYKCLRSIFKNLLFVNVKVFKKNGNNFDYL